MLSREILKREYGLLKRKNGVKPRGKRGYVMPKEEREKHHFQPHAKRVVSIDPVTFERVKVYRSLTAPREDGFRRENIRRAVKTAGVHGGYLWAFEGFEEGVMRVARKRGLEKKLNTLNLQKPTYLTMKRFYIDNNMTLQEVADKIGCSTGTVARYAREYGLSKKETLPVLTPKILKEELLSMSIEEVAKKYNRKASTIKTYKSKWLKEEKICSQKR